MIYHLKFEYFLYIKYDRIVYILNGEIYQKKATDLYILYNIIEPIESSDTTIYTASLSIQVEYRNLSSVQRSSSSEQNPHPHLTTDLRKRAERPTIQK